MKCGKCGAENREGRMFCAQCGAKLGWSCPRCGFDNEADERFCGGCGYSLEKGDTEKPSDQSPRAAVPRLEDMHEQLQSLIPDALAQKYLAAEQQAAGENRPITALFADISGFTPLSNTQSSETMFQLVQDCFKRLVSIVADYEGSISGFRGDGLLALFGAPILHENDAERAILAALDMRGSMEEQGLQVSIGVNTAMMTVGEIQTQLHSEYTAYGTDVILAQRLQVEADPGQILAGTGTHRLTRRIFDFELLSRLQVKGFTEPVSAYSVQHVKVHPEKLRGIEGLRARMIGREHEFADLKDAADAWLDGQGQMVNIIGEAGIGKSRLVSELKEYLASRDDVEQSCNILEGRCVSIGQPISYWPFLDILRSWFELGADDTEAEVTHKVRQHVEDLLPDRCDDILPFLGHLMNLKFGGELDTRLEHYSPEQISHHTMMRLRDIFVALTQKQRLLLILEDLHWADDLSLDLVSLLMDELMAYPFVLLCVYRPEQTHRVWRLGSQAQRKCLERYTEIQLQKLPPVASRRLVQELLAIDNLPDGVRDMILDKSEGNPFFIEEVIRSLIERGLVYQEDDRWKAKEDIVQLDVPDTIQSVVLARVDRLEAEAKYVLQCASVIGRLFKHRLLEHLTQKQRELDQYIAEFEERDLIYEERTIPELEYAFKHALTQEATYQGILEQRRRVFHREVARGIEKLYQERVEDFYEELAYHWERSGDDEKTLEYLMKAGEKAARRYLNEAAIDYYTRAIQLAEDMGISGDRLAEVYEARGQVHNTMSFYEECISDMMEAANLYTQRHKRANMYQWIATTYSQFIDDMNEAIRYARKTVEEIDPADKSRETARAYHGAAEIFIEAIDLEEGERLLGKALAISEEMGYKDLLASHYAWSARFDAPRMYGSNRSEIEQKRKVSLEKARSYIPYLKTNLPDYARVCNSLGWYTAGDERIYFFREALEAGTKCGSAWAVTDAYNLGSAYRYRDEIQKAIGIYEQGWQFGIRARYTAGGTLSSIAGGLISLYTSRGERSKLLQMMLQVLDSTLVLHRKPKVYPLVQRRWNGTVENIYSELHNVAPEVYRELDESLGSRLDEADTDGERFFYHGQLALLALLDGRRSRAETHAQELWKLRPHAGNFAQRIHWKTGYAAELMSVPPDQRQTVITKLLRPIDRINDLKELFDFIWRVIPADELTRSVDWDHVNQLVSQLLRSAVIRLGSFYDAICPIEVFYEIMERQDMFRQICQKFGDEHREILQEYGFTQLHLEPHEPSASYSRLDSVDTFDSDSLKPAWEWVDPEGDCACELIPPSGLRITVPLTQYPGHNLWIGTPLNAPRLLQPISGDFAIETRISDGEAGRKSGGLLAWKDEHNYIRFDTEPDSSYEGIIHIGFARSAEWFVAGRGFLESETLILRLERQGDRFTGYVRADGENWYRCGWADIPMEDPIQVGIHALCYNRPTPTSTHFEYFRIHRAD